MVGIRRGNSWTHGLQTFDEDPCLELRWWTFEIKPTDWRAVLSFSQRKGTPYLQMYVIDRPCPRRVRTIQFHRITESKHSSIARALYDQHEVITMSRVEEIQSAIDSLTPQDYARLREWFANKDWERWDRQLEADAVAGKLDFLKDEAQTEKDQGRLQDL